MATAIKNIDNLTIPELKSLVEQGGKFGMFEYTISIILATFKNPTDIYFIRPGESTTSYSIGSTILTFFLGWWGFPWGPIYSIGSLYTNLSGGKDVTSAVMQELLANYTAQQNAAGIGQNYNIPETQNTNSAANHNNDNPPQYNIPS